MIVEKMDLVNSATAEAIPPSKSNQLGASLEIGRITGYRKYRESEAEKRSRRLVWVGLFTSTLGIILNPNEGIRLIASFRPSPHAHVRGGI
jgi:hypothetical protein